MTVKGIVSRIDYSIEKAQVSVPLLDGTVAPNVSIPRHITELAVGDKVAVLFFNSGLSDGCIVGVID